MYQSRLADQGGALAGLRGGGGGVGVGISLDKGIPGLPFPTQICLGFEGPGNRAQSLKPKPCRTAEKRQGPPLVVRHISMEEVEIY